MLKIQKAVWACAIASAMLLGACSHNQQLSTLKSGYDVYDAGMKIAADMYANGQITESEWNTIAAIGHRYIGAYKVAVEAFWQYEELKDYESERRYLQALQAFQSVYAEFMIQIRRIQNGQEPNSNDGNNPEAPGAVNDDHAEKLRQRRSDDWRHKEIGVGDAYTGAIP